MNFAFNYDVLLALHEYSHNPSEQKLIHKTWYKYVILNEDLWTLTLIMMQY